ncbi:hypothetical protein BDY24DRAFT_416750 [Mrakia frigida]|uniref:uncharacterized protein n=1 Tax=Mrakia frigida TaxID=29902 RepID=UPI003FCC0318
MCYPTTCSICKLKTWAGCGKHIETALAGVPETERCAGWKTGKCPGVQAAKPATEGGAKKEL